MACIRKRQSMRRRPVTSPKRRTVLALLAIASLTQPSIGFAPSSLAQRHQERDQTRRYFRHIEDLKTEDVSAASTIFDNLPFTLQPGKMPTWLRQPRAQNYEEYLLKLREAMENSFFTDKEKNSIILAIEHAAKGDKNKIAGAAEFCLILVETMEMGPNALVAAAFHYCLCITARERSLVLPEGSFSFSDFFAHFDENSIVPFGHHAVEIAKDAARLKKIEMVAASVMQNAKSARVSPDDRDAENLRKLLLTETKDWRALAIRSAASLYRLRGIMSAGNVELTPESVRASREALHIYGPLASRLGMHRLKNELEDAAFQILYRRQYETVTSLALQSRRQKRRSLQSNGRIKLTKDAASIYDIGHSMKDVLQGVTQQVREMLANDKDFSTYAENVSVTARVKEPYSMWRKMLRSDSDHILQVPDALALRIILDAKKLSPEEDDEITRARERALCYYAQKLCTERWRPAENPRFKDYIERPKPNGYQSLHYTASTHWAGEDWSLEIQVRSWEMHSVAEYGLASHWEYKAKKHGDHDQEVTSTKDAYLKSVQEWHWQQQSGGLARKADAAPATSEEFFYKPEDETMSKIRADRIRARTAQLAPYIEAFTEAKSDLEREHVFVFLSQSPGASSVHADGKVVALPAGACVLDALREGERQFGIKVNWRQFDMEVEHNGVLANVTQKLRNGDVLTVPIQEMMQAMGP